MGTARPEGVGSNGKRRGNQPSASRTAEPRRDAASRSTLWARLSMMPAAAGHPKQGASKPSMSRRIFYDGLNLALARGTGIATSTRMLTALAREAGDEVGLV